MIIYSYLPTYLPTNLPTYLPTNQPTNLPTYLPLSLSPCHLHLRGLNQGWMRENGVQRDGGKILKGGFHFGPECLGDVRSFVQIRERVE